MPVFTNAEEFEKTAAGGEAASRRFTADVEADEREAQRDAVAAAETLLGIASSLPAAVLAASRAEAARLQAIDKAHPRLVQVNSTTQLFADGAPAIARLRARAARAIEVAQDAAPGLYGFVEDEAGRPLSRVTVALRAGKASARSTVTAEDGYFRVAFPPQARSAASKTKAANAVTIVLSDESGAVLHKDPVPIEAGTPAAYREYVIERPVRRKTKKSKTKPAR